LLSIVFTSHWVFPIAGRFLIGLGSSAAILGVFKIVRMTFSERRFPRMLYRCLQMRMVFIIEHKRELPDNLVFEFCGFVYKAWQLMYNGSVERNDNGSRSLCHCPPDILCRIHLEEE
jgi:hypothetical protein